MPRLVALNRAQWQPGTYESSALPIPVGLSRVTVTMERNNWPERTGDDPAVVRVTAYLSFDGGVTFPMFWGAGAPGGDLFHYRTGALITHSNFIFDLPEPDNPDRVAKVTMEVFERLRTQIDYDVV